MNFIHYFALAFFLTAGKSMLFCNAQNVHSVTQDERWAESGSELLVTILRDIGSAAAAGSVFGILLSEDDKLMVDGIEYELARFTREHGEAAGGHVINFYSRPAVVRLNRDANQLSTGYIAGFLCGAIACIVSPIVRISLYLERVKKGAD